MDIVRRLDKFVQKIAEGLRSADKRFVGDCIRGMARSGSTMLTEIGRALGEKIPLQKTVTRLSRMASSKWFNDERLRANHVALVAPLTKEKLPFVAVDLTDVAKPYGKKKDLCLVRDGSSRRKRLDDGRSNAPRGRRKRKSSLVTLVFEAVLTTLKSHIVVPLLTEVFSTETPGFKSQNDIIEHWLRYLAPSISPEAIWLFDRGFDGGQILQVLHDLKLRWVVRMVGKRNIQFQDGAKQMKEIAAGLHLPYTTEVSTRGKGSKDRVHSVRFTFIPARLKDLPERCGLIVAQIGRSPRIMLLCWKLPENAKEAAMLIRAYLRRWGVEDFARAIKQLCGAEDVRVLTFRAVARLVRLAAMALAWLALLLLTSPATAAKLMARAKSVGKDPLFAVYRMALGLRDLL